MLSYAALGDATMQNGLRALYDEEQTDEVLIIEHLAQETEFINYWRNNGNSNLYDLLKVEFAVF